MKTSTIWWIAVGVGIPTVLIVIGLIGLLIKFFLKRCRAKAWDDINTLPKTPGLSENGINPWNFGRRKSLDRQPLYQSATNNAMEISDTHIAISIDAKDIPPDQDNKVEGQEHTLVQIQRDRLNRLREEDNRLKPAQRIKHGEDDIQRAIDQVQKEFEESVGTAADKLKRSRKK